MPNIFLIANQNIHLQCITSICESLGLKVRYNWPECPLCFRGTAFVLSGTYAVLIYLGRNFMKCREKLDLRTPLMLWSLTLAVFRWDSCSLRKHTQPSEHVRMHRLRCYLSVIVSVFWKLSWEFSCCTVKISDEWIRCNHSISLIFTVVDSSSLLLFSQYNGRAADGLVHVQCGDDTRLPAVCVWHCLLQRPRQQVLGFCVRSE